MALKKSSCAAGVVKVLLQSRVQIALLQETHLTDHEHSKLKRDWVAQVFYSSYNSKSRGVAILIHKNLPFTVEKIVKDREGRYIAITGILYGEQILLCNVYAPNVYDSAFYSKFLAEVSPICPSHVLIGGDFNTGLMPSSDYSPPKTQPLSKMAKATNGLCNDLGLFDAWRICNPNVRDFTFFSRPHQSFSRIDFLFVSRSVLDKTHLCSINPHIYSLSHTYILLRIHIFSLSHSYILALTVIYTLFRIHIFSLAHPYILSLACKYITLHIHTFSLSLSLLKKNVCM
uniref:exodeoxyribonuclease III n=1 Tax=Oryzias latipes TaxID=8090 RepID=A0A3P9IXZ2_ORYLA